VGSWFHRQGAAYLKERLVIFKEERVGGRARVTIDEERVLWQGWTEIESWRQIDDRKTDMMCYNQHANSWCYDSIIKETGFIHHRHHFRDNATWLTWANIIGLHATYSTHNIEHEVQEGSYAIKGLQSINSSIQITD